MSFVESIKKRGLEPENVFISSFFAGLNELGILNQAVVYLAGHRVGRYLATYCQEKGNLDTISDGDEVEQCSRALARLNADLTITIDPADVSAEREGDSIVIKINNLQCRFCPKGVGEAALTGTLCPFPGLLEDFLCVIVGRKFKLEKAENTKPLVKDGDWCQIRFTETFDTISNRNQQFDSGDPATIKPIIRI
jgi:predicted hydrocarbon binding protein